MDLNYFELIGEENLRKLINDFYLSIAGDDLIRPMYPGELVEAEERLYLFMQQFLGGPKTYNEQRGTPMLRRRHVSFKVDIKARDRWIELMMNALDRNDMVDIAKFYLRKYFGDTATFLINSNE